MQRPFTKVADGSVPNGRLYAGDVNLILDLVAALTDFAQVLSLGTLRIGSADISLVKYATGEARLTSGLRIDTFARLFSAFFLGRLTDSQRDALPAAQRDFGAVIQNQTRGRVEWNAGTAAEPLWYPIACDASGNLVMPTGGTIIIGGVPIEELVSPYAPVVTSLPDSPDDLDECYLNVDSFAQLWHLKWIEGESAWLAVGAPSSLYSVVSGGNIGGTGAWVNTPGGPSLGLPADGDYEVEFGGDLEHRVGGETSSIGVTVNGTPPNSFETEKIVKMNTANGEVNFAVGGNYASSVNVIGAQGTISLRFKQSASGGIVTKPWIRARPIRLTP